MLFIDFRFFEKLSNAQTKPPFKVFTLILTSGLLGVGIYGMSLLNVEFRPEWMLDPETECELQFLKLLMETFNLHYIVSNWYYAHKEFFPSDGELGQLYIKVSFNLSKDFHLIISQFRG